MTPLVYTLAGGAALLPAIAVLAVAILARWIVRRRRLTTPALGLGGLAVVAIVLSAPAMPGWFVGLWATTVAAWLLVGPIRVIGWRSAPSLAALIGTLAAGAIEIRRERLTPLPPGGATTLCVIGDSLAAGLGRPGEVAWPARLRSDHRIRVVDLSRPGCTVAQAVPRAAAVARESGVVLIEVGGNDLIGRTDPARFGADLDALARLVTGPGRAVVMCELPRFPLGDAYGLQQRRIARQYGITLVPRRRFAGVLATPSSTVDGVHLTNAGHQRFADLV